LEIRERERERGRDGETQERGETRFIVLLWRNFIEFYHHRGFQADIHSDLPSLPPSLSLSLSDSEECKKETER